MLKDYGVTRSPQHLQAFPIVVADMPLLGSGWRFQQAGSAILLEIPIAPCLSVTTTESAAQSTIRGVGITRLLYDLAAEAMESGIWRVILEEL